MSNLEPTGPPQPTLNQVYEARENPTTTDPAQQQAAARNANAPDSSSQRIPAQQSAGFQDAQPSALGYGVSGAPPGEETRGFTQQNFRDQELDGDTQMRASGEGDIAKSVDQKRGATGAQSDLASDLDRKREEQAPMREAIKGARQHQVDVGGILSDRGGPANPVDKNNYPNS